jgi:hypothetical protein
MHSKGSLPQWPPTGALQMGQLLVKLAQAKLKIDDISVDAKYNGLDDDWWHPQKLALLANSPLWQHAQDFSVCTHEDGYCCLGRACLRRRVFAAFLLSDGPDWHTAVVVECA